MPNDLKEESHNEQNDLSSLGKSVEVYQDIDLELSTEDTITAVLNRINKFEKLSLELFDQIDRIYQASFQINNLKFTEDVTKVRNQTIDILNQYGFEILQVEGQKIDGKSMISIGNVSKEQFAPYLEPYEVYSVFQHGFRDKETKVIIRKAKVITVV